MRGNDAFVISLLFILLGLTACSDPAKKYRDISELEKPPQMEVVDTKSAPETEELETKPDSAAKISTGVGDVVSLPDESHLVLNRPFDEAWELVGKALTLTGMEITDRDREKGQYYVVFDPDTAELKNSEKPDFLDMLLTDDAYPKGRYLITFYENPRSVKLNVEFLEYPASDAQTDSSLPDKGVEKLLKKLYTALHDDLPLN